MNRDEEIAQQLELLATHRQTLHHYLRQRALLGGDAYATPSVIHGIRGARSEIRRIKSALHGWGVDVEDHPDDRTDDAPGLSPKKEADPISAVGVDKRILRTFLEERFNLDELEVLCLDIEQDLAADGVSLPVNLELVAGETKTNKIIHLMSYLDRRGYLSYLVNAAQRARRGFPGA
jgi:hypothetical protein